MNQQFSQLDSRVRVPITWQLMHGRAVSETDFIRSIGELPVAQLLPGLITLLQYGDASEPPNYKTLDNHLYDLFPTQKARQIAQRLALGTPWIFFSKWQLLFATKLLCAFGCPDAGKAEVNSNKLLDLLLMTNGFYPYGESRVSTEQGIMDRIPELTLLSYSLIEHEHPLNLIGRYSEIFGRLADPANRSGFKTWVDIQEVVATKLGVQLDALKAVLFLLYGYSMLGLSWPDDGAPGPRPGCLDPKHCFADLQVPQGRLARILELVATSPNQIREEHLYAYGDGIGNPVDLRTLLRKPAITLTDGTLAGISGQLLIQRYTCGLYWDIHDALPNDTHSAPNRQSFQTFFGELHEHYGGDVLERISDAQLRAKRNTLRKTRLLSEQDYLSASGSNPDNLLIETKGSRNTRCTLFEFKVGRPRYIDTILGGDVQAFHDDLHLKISEGLDQEIDFCRQLQCGQREILGLRTRDITGWFFVIVVTDPFPTIGILLEPLRSQLTNAPDLGNVRKYGPFVLSLAELEQLETLPKHRISGLSCSLIGMPGQTVIGLSTHSTPIVPKANHSPTIILNDWRTGLWIGSKKLFWGP